jgi:hypothetical protein
MQRVGSTASPRRRSSQTALALNVAGGGIALTCVPLACVWFLLHDSLGGAKIDPSIAARLKNPDAFITAQAAAPSFPVASEEQQTPTFSLASASSTAIAPERLMTASIGPAVATKPQPPADPVAAARSTKLTKPSVTVASLDVTSSISPGTFSRSTATPLGDRFTAPTPPPQIATPATQDAARPAPAPVRQAALGAPVPTPRPSVFPQSTNPAVAERPKPNKAVASVSPSKLTVFEKLFGKPDAPNVALAYATTDGGVASDGESLTPGLSAPYDKFTAVYDIKAAKVYMPDGTVLEAHSGRGPMFDNPKYANERMRGPTPPHVYTLKEREAIFFGVRALRLTPVGGEKAIFGRNGLLAHTYLYGPRGESFGCVSFKDYAAFLRAFDKGEVRKLAVLASVE